VFYLSIFPKHIISGFTTGSLTWVESSCRKITKSPFKENQMNHSTTRIKILSTPTGTMRCNCLSSSSWRPLSLYLFLFWNLNKSAPMLVQPRINGKGHGFVVIVPEVFHELNPIGTAFGLRWPKGKETKANPQILPKKLEASDSGHKFRWFVTLNGKRLHQVNLCDGVCLGGPFGSYRALWSIFAPIGFCLYADDKFTPNTQSLVKEGKRIPFTS